MLNEGFNNIRPVLIRPLAKEDAPAYRALMLEGYALAADAFTSVAEERASEPLTWWERRIQDPNGLSRAFGAFDDGLLVGTVALEYSAKVKTRHKAAIVGLYVAPANRNRGAGLALIKALIDQSQTRPGVTMLTLTVTDGNLPAIRLYASMGFEPWGIEPRAVFTGTEYKSKVHMCLILDSVGQSSADTTSIAQGASSTPPRISRS